MFAITLFGLASVFAPLAACHSHAGLLMPRDLGPREVAAPKFGYTGEQGPMGWFALDPEKNKLCSRGKEQSPINFDNTIPGKVLETAETRPKLDYKTASDAPFINKGTTVEVEVTGELTLPSDGSVWELAQFHFHTPSEHRILEEYYPLEMHMVHKKKDDKEKLLVMGVLFELQADGKTTPMVQGLMESVKTIPKLGNETRTGALDFQPVVEHINQHDVYQYNGSLTTAPCTEGVRWLVSAVPMPVDATSYLEAKHVMKFNSRVTQNTPEKKNLLDSCTG